MSVIGKSQNQIPGRIPNIVYANGLNPYLKSYLMAEFQFFSRHKSEIKYQISKFHNSLKHIGP